MRWEDDRNGTYCDLYHSRGDQVGWVYNTADRHASDITDGVGTGDYYGCADGKYVRAETLDECKALVLVLCRMEVWDEHTDVEV